MYSGKIVERAPVAALFAEPEHPYSIGLLGSIPQLHVEQERLAAIEGQVPNALTPVGGCRFHPRCPFAVEALHAGRAAAGRGARRALCRMLACAARCVDGGGCLRAALTATLSPPAEGGVISGRMHSIRQTAHRTCPRHARMDALSPHAGEGWGEGRRMTSVAGRYAIPAPLLRVDALVKHFPLRKRLLSREGGAVRAVDGMSFDVAVGETLALVGESGCGKSTTGRLVLRLLEPTSGKVFFDGEDLFSLSDAQMRAHRRALQIIFQDPFASLNPRMTVGQTLAEPLALAWPRTGSPQRARRRNTWAGRALARARPAIPARIFRRPAAAHRHRACAGRRAAAHRLRRAGLRARRVDPGAGRQPAARSAAAAGAFLHLHRTRLAVVKFIATRIAVMYLGKIVEYADKRALFAAPRHPYTRALLSSIPVPEPGGRQRRILLEGDVPSASAPPSGCHFRTRCPYARPRCAAEEPQLVATGGHAVACHFWSEIDPAAPSCPAAPQLHPTRGLPRCRPHSGPFPHDHDSKRCSNIPVP